MYKSRQLRSKKEQRRLEGQAATAAGLDWLNLRPSKARSRVAHLIELLKDADLLRKHLRSRNASLPASTREAQQLLSALDRVNEIFSLYRGTRVLWVTEKYDLQEMFGLNAKRLESDDAYYSETMLINYALELLRFGSIQRLRTCRECTKWYYATADHQVQCSAKCRQRFASHDAAFRVRRREYMKTYRQDEKNRNKRAHSLARRTK